VLAALHNSPRLLESQAITLGAETIAMAEVKAALKTMRPGTSPGLDRIPLAIYRKLGEAIWPLLARVFTAIGEVKQKPAGFLEGAISMLHKKGERVVAGNYRPITLLNTDYRLLAKILALRLQPCLTQVIHPAQTAFIRGRRRGEPVLLLQALAAWLPQQSPPQTAVAMLCDFAKAFDTVDRSFLFAVMERLGMGTGFLSWVHTLLSHTRACAVVNGFRSPSEPFYAGVRQGCPLSPLLYLFIGQALIKWWEAQGWGIDGPPRCPRLVGAQYADDATPFCAA
jgi:hypothetical protein